MLSIGNKKYRNLQEQVGYNAEQIEKIFEVLDGLNVQDSVIVIDDISTPLTSEELEIINKEVAFIVYSGQLYIKKSQDASLAYFDIVFTIVESSTIISFNSKEIQVTLSNGALGIVVSTASTYTVANIDTLLSAKANVSYVDAQLALKANLSGADFTGPITAPSIIENMSGYSFTQLTVSDVTLTPIYVGACKNGNKLTIVYYFSILRTAGGHTVSQLAYIGIPASVGNKLYAQAIGNYVVLDVKQVFFTKNILIDNKQVLMYTQKNSNQQLVIAMPSGAIDDIPLNETYYGRYEVTFLLNDSLAS